MNQLNLRYLAETLNLTDNDFMVSDSDLAHSKALILHYELDKKYDVNDLENLRRFAIKRRINSRILVNLWDQCSGEHYNKDGWKNIQSQLSEQGLILD